MPNTTKSIHSRSAEATRPDLTPEQEAEICGLAPGRVLYLRQRLDQAHPGPEYERAWDEYIKATSVTLMVVTSGPSELLTVMALSPRPILSGYVPGATMTSEPSQAALIADWMVG